MFVGHYAAALAAKAAEPRTPLWTYVLGAQLLDVGYSALVVAGIEKFRVNESLPGNPLELIHMPYSHGLPAALVWSLVAALLCKPLLKLTWRASAVVGLVVFSHWLLDWIVHRPDLELWYRGPKVGLGLWNYPAAEMALELSLLAVAGGAWIAWRKSVGRQAWPAVLFLALLGGMATLFALPAPPPESPLVLGITGLVLFGVIALIAWPVDRAYRPGRTFR